MSEQHLREFIKIFDSVPYYVLLVSSDHRIVAFNQFFARLLNNEREELINSYYSSMIHTTSDSYHDSPLEEAIRKNIAVEKDYYDQNSKRWIRSSVYPTQYNTSSNKKIYLHMLRDIHLEKKERKMETLRKQFIETTSHELLTPITLIKGHTDFLLKNISELDKTKIENSLKSTQKNVSRLLNLIQNVNDLSKIEQNNFELQYESIAFRPFIVECVQDFKKIIGDDISFKDYTKGNIMIRGDRHRLRQVMDNLIQNAIKFTPGNNRKIIVTLKQHNQTVLASVLDNGAGIRSQDKLRIFEKFVSVPTKYSVSGSGVGLYLSREIIEAHNGEISAKSPGVNAGTRIVITLPLT